MRLSTFQAIRFGQSFWNSADSWIFKKPAEGDKIQRANDVLNFLNARISSGAARVDAVPGLYVLRITSGAKSVVSVIGELDYNEKSLLFMNEEIHKEKLEGYKSLFNHYKIQTNPILTFYKGENSVRLIVSDILNNEPSISLSISGVLYELWHVTDQRNITNIKENLSNVQRLYIADGHHRFSIFKSVFSKTSAKLVISVTDSNSMLLKSCHRIILGTVSPDWQARVSKIGHVSKASRHTAFDNKILLFFRNGDSFTVNLGDESPGKNLYNLVKTAIIEEGLGVQNYSERVFPLPGNINPIDIDKIFDLYKTGSVVLFVPSIGISDFFEAIDNGNKLPATSTWFEPKIVEGFIVRKF